MILSKGFLQASARSRNISLSSKSGILLENKRISLFNKMEGLKMYDLFLSHSSLDTELVLTLVQIINECGYSVYVDWIDDSHLDRDSVTKETAELIHKRIDQSYGLSYISTSNSSNSKWCPWELGVADGLLNRKVCILPVTDKVEYFYQGQEYLGLYPYVVYKTVGFRSDFYIIDNKQNSKPILLSEWLLN